MAFSPDGARLLTGAYAGKLRAWRVSDDTPVMTIRGHDFGNNSVALALEGGLFASASVEESILIAIGGVTRTVRAFLASLVAVVIISVAAWAVLDSVQESTAEANPSPYNTTRP